ncbi:MAG: YbhB/YbcL family Raf kinase inhibitor-like protein [Candidatus Nanohaloarchaea archaeon]
MKMYSPEFDDGDHMPEKVGYTRKNLNPELFIENVPGEAESLVLVMDDPDAVEPAGKVWDHWTVWNIDPEKQRIQRGESPGFEGKNDFGERGYGGPNPPDATHIYSFRLYAVDTQLELGGDSTKQQVLQEIEGNVIDKAELEGKYDPV